MNKKKIHELCLSIPPIAPDKFIELKADIAKKGVLEPIWLYEGKILDGRHRYEAAHDLNIEPTFNNYEGDDPLGFIISLNTFRKTLTSTQRACVALDALVYEEKLAKQRQIESGRITGKANAKNEEKIPQALSKFSKGKSETMFEEISTQASKRAPQSRDIVAAKLETNPHYVSTVKKIRSAAPELFDKMKAGKLDAASADILFKFQQERPELYPEALSRIEKFPKLTARNIVNAVKNETISASNKNLTFETGKRFRVILSDPPWRYGTPPPGVSGIEDHYPTMSIAELAALGDKVKKVSAENSVLFMWTTSPHLQLSFQVISSWGFEYKTSLIWHKVKHNMGFYSSVRHEFLLICTRGSCTPERLIFEPNDDGDLTHDTFHPEPSVFPSASLKGKQFKLDDVSYAKEFEYREEPMEFSKIGVDTVFEEKSTTHSKKPNYYYALIERLYPHGDKLEMFCREPQEGWTAWGNQSEKKMAT